MKILVTGAKGFIGTEFCRLLVERGHEVCGIDRKASSSPFEAAGMRWENCDLLDLPGLQQLVAEFQPEAMVNLGAKTGLKNHPADSEYFAANTRGTNNLMEVARGATGLKRAVYVSTKYVWRGDGEAGHRQYSPATTYGESKVLMEEAIWNQDGGCDEWCIVRPTTIWGPGMSFHYQRFLEMVKKGYYFHIGVRPVKKDMGYVGNAAFQLMRLLEVDRGKMHEQIFYITDYDTVILEEWAEGFREEFGSAEIRRVPKLLAKAMALGGDVMNFVLRRRFPFTSFRYRNLTQDDCCDMSKTEEVCGELPYTMKEAIKATASWHRKGPR